MSFSSWDFLGRDKKFAPVYLNVYTLLSKFLLLFSAFAVEAAEFLTVLPQNISKSDQIWKIWEIVLATFV